MNATVDQSGCRVAVGNDRVAAAALIEKDRNIDLLDHEERSGADVSLLVWPTTGEVKATAALVLHRDGTGFVHLPTDAPNESVVSSLYAAIKQRAIDLNANVVLVLLPPNLRVFEPELIAHGYKHVSDVMTLHCEARDHIRGLAAMSPQPISIEESDAGEARLADVIQATYTESLSDPALGSNHSAARFLERLKFEEASRRDRFVLQVNDRDAAVCLISRYEGERYLVVRYVGVHPEFRGQKLGAKILAASLAKVWDRRYRLASVDVDAANHFAVTLYEELGFRPYVEAAEFMLPLD